MWETKVLKIREELLRSISDLSFEELNEKPSDGEWSIAQIVLHLSGAETRFLKLALDAAQENEGETGEEVDLSVFEDKEKKLKAPIEPSEEPHSIEELKSALQASRQLTEKFINTYSERELSQKTMNHHRFGNMPVWQVLELLGRHEERHIHQIEQTKKKIS
ncbi:DinB family protein [Rossellomorea aquimaris]|uniref:DinB family protein n=1 Tax=Rossellomorea aquimaris TaxID=189382 RepID=UPI001CD7107F|nr:DinB family protein [Rossellomorea aquimaris]MCA1056719.1 DinB family protein [Rossellomorea aquimaris]